MRRADSNAEVNVDQDVAIGVIDTLCAILNVYEMLKFCQHSIRI